MEYRTQDQQPRAPTNKWESVIGRKDSDEPAAAQNERKRRRPTALPRETHEKAHQKPSAHDHTTTISLKPRGVDPVKVKCHSTQRQTRPRHYYQTHPSEGMDDSPTQRGSWDGAPRPTTTRSLKPRGVDPVKVKRHPTQRQTRPRHYYQTHPSEGMDDSPTQRSSWDGAPRPTTTRSLKPRGVDPVKVKRHSTQRQTRQCHYYNGRGEDLAPLS